jgi:hypothetical protein
MSDNKSLRRHFLLRAKEDAGGRQRDVDDAFALALSCY